MTRDSIVGLMPSSSVSSARLSGPRMVLMPSTEAWVGVQGEVTVVVQQPGFHAGDAGGEPLTVAERDELVLAAVHQQDRDANGGQLEPPRAGVGHAVVPPALAARGQALAPGVHEVLG